MNTIIAWESGGNEGVSFIPAKILAVVYGQPKTIGHVRRGALGISVASIETVTKLIHQPLADE